MDSMQGVKMKHMTEDQRAILNDLKDFYYSGRVPFLALNQKYPGKEEQLLGLDVFLEDFIHFWMKDNANETQDRQSDGQNCTTTT